MALTTYRYLFADLITNQVIAELPLTGVNFTQALNQAGTFTGDILITDVNEINFNITNGTIPGRTALYVDRNGVLVWGGIVWSRTYDSATQRISIAAQEFESYFEHRRVNYTKTYTQADQLAIVQDLVNTAQAATGGNIGVVVGSETSGVLVSRTFYNYELKTVYQAIMDLSRSETGFDFNIEVAYDVNGNPTKSLRLSYPRSGALYSASNPNAPVFEFPAGNLESYTYPEDGSLAANLVYAVGANSNEAKIIQQSPLSGSANPYVALGWPLLETSANFSDLTDTTLIQNLADAHVQAVWYPPTTMTLVAPPYIAPVLGSYHLGDDVRVRIKDDRFPNQIDATYRLVALSVTPGETSGEKATLTVVVPPSTGV